jgi:hypothetical protein
MKSRFRNAFLLLLSLLLPVVSPAQTAAEIERATAYLAKTRDAVLASVRGLSAEQLAFKPAPEKWSVAEVLEHIGATEDYLMGVILKQVMSAPPRPAGEDVKAIDDFVLKAIPNRASKLKAPEPLVPTKRFGSVEGSRKHFAESRAATIAFVKETKGLRDHAIDSPLGHRLDAYQWVLFIAAHSDRHQQQIEEVKADAKFPKS